MHTIHKTDEAFGFIPLPGDAGKPITVVGTDAIRDNFDVTCLQQAVNSRMAPGVTDVILNPDGHAGYGAPVGCVMVSPTHIYPGPVGVDIKCSMSLLQLDIPEDAIRDKQVRRALINAIVERTPTGAGRGQRNVKKGRHVDRDLGVLAVTEGATRPIRVMTVPTMPFVLAWTTSWRRVASGTSPTRSASSDPMAEETTSASARSPASPPGHGRGKRPRPSD
jgi:tRNA-splicing ligase RtcB